MTAATLTLIKTTKLAFRTLLISRINVNYAIQQSPVNMSHHRPKIPMNAISLIERIDPLPSIGSCKCIKRHQRKVEGLNLVCVIFYHVLFIVTSNEK
jgi:hypothetical protein